MLEKKIHILAGNQSLNLALDIMQMKQYCSLRLYNKTACFGSSEWPNAVDVLSAWNRERKEKECIITIGAHEVHGGSYEPHAHI